MNTACASDVAKFLNVTATRLEKPVQVRSYNGQAEETDEELVERLLPTIYAGYKNAFSKAASDELPPHRTYDHKIQLEANNSLGYSPLY